MIERVSLRRGRDLGAIIGDGLRLLTSNWPSMAMTVAPAILVSAALALIQYAVQDSTGLVLAVFVLSFPVSIVAYELVSAAAILQLDGSDRGRPLTTGDALDAAQARFGDVVSASLRSTAIIMLFAVTILGLPWAIHRAVRWAFIIPSIMLEGQTGGTALDYSAALVQGRWWLTLGRLLATGLVLGIPAFVINMIIVAAIPGVAGVLLSQVPYLFVIPFGIITVTLIYFDYEQRKGPAA